MKFFILIHMLLTLSAFADPRVKTVIDYLRTTPATVKGNISFDQKVDAFKTKYSWFNTGLQVEANKGISFSFSDQHLDIRSAEGLIIPFAGLAVKVKNIYYHEASGKFTVKTDTFMGIYEDTFKEKIEKILNDKYKPKVIEAFGKLKTIRQQNSAHDVNKIITTVAGIFSTDNSISVPTMRGHVELVFYPDQGKELKIDKWKAQISAHDAISAGAQFVKTKDKLSFSSAEIRSSKGIRLFGETKFPEIASLNFQSIHINDRKIGFRYDIGAEEVLAGFQALIGVIAQYSGHPSQAILKCDPLRLKQIRESIDGTLKKEISNMIKRHRVVLINGGVSKELLAAFE